MAGELNAKSLYRPLDTTGEVALEAVRYDAATGLVPVVVQDAKTGDVLMMAYANREALKRTFGTGQAWFWSRSRQDYWRKGATSGNVLHVQEVRIDCDGDTVLYLVHPVGPACHTGETSCFYRRMERSVTEADDGHLDEPEAAITSAAVGASGAQSALVDVGSSPDAGSSSDSAENAGVMGDLWAVIEQRFTERPEGSYTTYLFEQGVDKAAKKAGEEAVEIVIAAKNAASGTQEGRQELAAESADLLYHLMVLWKTCGVSPDDVFRVLEKRAK